MVRDAGMTTTYDIDAMTPTANGGGDDDSLEVITTDLWRRRWMMLTFSEL